MPRVRDLLHRFRPAGAPGAATPAGVPVDRRADLAAELEPLFARLADLERECAAIREQSEVDAATIRTRGIERARAVLADARTRSQSERAAASVRMQRRAETEAAAQLRDAERSAVELRQRAGPLLPHYVDQVVATVRELLSDQPTAPAADVVRP